MRSTSHHADASGVKARAGQSLTKCGGHLRKRMVEGPRPWGEARVSAPPAQIVLFDLKLRNLTSWKLDADKGHEGLQTRDTQKEEEQNQPPLCHLKPHNGDCLLSAINLSAKEPRGLHSSASHCRHRIDPAASSRRENLCAGTVMGPVICLFFWCIVKKLAKIVTDLSVAECTREYRDTGVLMEEFVDDTNSVCGPGYFEYDHKVLPRIQLSYTPISRGILQRRLHSCRSIGQ
eukprot:516983-Rhodomonas_salina.2